MNTGVNLLHMRKTLILLLAFPILLPCMARNAGYDGDEDLVLSFEGRNIDIAPYFRDFPYSLFYLSDDGQKLLLTKSGEESRLQWLDTGTAKDIREATDVVDLNFATRNCWFPTWNPTDGYIYWEGDESNDEIINIYRTKPGSNKVERLTDIPYIYAWGFNPSKTKIAYVARLGQNEDRLDELRVLDLNTLEDTMICQDNPKFRFTWGKVCWQPQEKGFTLLALRDMDRTYTNVVYVDAASGEMTLLTDSTKTASLSNTQVLSEWASDDKCVFISDQTGWSNLYSFDLSTGKTTQLTDSKIGISSARYLEYGKKAKDRKKCLLVAESNPMQTVLTLIDPSTGTAFQKATSPLGLTLAGSRGDKAFATGVGTTDLFNLVSIQVTGKGMQIENMLGVPQDIKDNIVHSTVKRLSIPTFDIDPATGKTRTLHAYLYVPDNPLPKEKQLLLLESFYGGENYFSNEIQIYCQAGMYVLSASPRGSSGFGRDFEALNDKDLGGNEILDIIKCAQFISDSLGIPASRVGCFGMSHGGYATMRLMTFPGHVNGHEESFPFGFGIEAAGFADIIWAHQHSNIPDWTTLEAGDPVNPEDWYRIQDRSSLNHADKITGPLLLLHGTHDNRVNIWGSKFMAVRLEELGKPYRYVEFPGMGHGFKGTAANKKLYESEFSFLEDMVLNRSSF